METDLFNIDTISEVIYNKNMHKPIHKHLIIRAETNKTPTDQYMVEKWMRELINDIGMVICKGPISAYVDQPGNKGLTCVTIIETSHVSMHVWDETNPGLLQLDVYTCGPFDPKIVFNKLKESFEPVKIQWKYLDREHDLTEEAIDEKTLDRTI